MTSAATQSSATATPTAAAPALLSKQDCNAKLTAQIDALRNKLTTAGVKPKALTRPLEAVKDAYGKAYKTIGERGDNLSGSVGPTALESWTLPVNSPAKQIKSVDASILGHPTYGSIITEHISGMNAEIASLWEPVLSAVKARREAPPPAPTATASADGPKTKPAAPEKALVVRGSFTDPVLTGGRTLRRDHFPKQIWAAAEAPSSTEALKALSALAPDLKNNSGKELDIIDGLTYMILKGHHAEAAFNFVGDNAADFVAQKGKRLLADRTDNIFKLVQDGKIKLSQDAYRTAYFACQHCNLAEISADAYAKQCKELVQKAAEPADAKVKDALFARIEMRLLFIATKLQPEVAGKIGLGELLESAEASGVTISADAREKIFQAGERGRIAHSGLSSYLTLVRRNVEQIHTARADAQNLPSLIAKTETQLNILIGSFTQSDFAPIGIERARLRLALDSMIKNESYHKNMVELAPYRKALDLLSVSVGS